MPRVKFIIAGDGISRAEFDGLINRLGLGENVLLLGWREDIPELLAVMDVFVLTSLWEGLPISVLEAMAASRPVIATDTGAVAEVITEAQTGFLVQPRDMDLMAQKLLVLLNDEQLRKLVAGRARDSLGDNFTVENMVRDTESLYGSLLKEG
jgi:glycosyltransferase involved in cell wall biosynthesis